jgi:flagellar biosynthesis chaperone FliJ
LTVNSEDIRNYENQIGKAREESARAERQVAQIEVERKKRLVEKEKLQGTVVSHPYVGVA